MHEQEIRTYAGLMEELQLTGLEVEADGVRVRLERLHAPAAPVVVSQTPVPAAAAPAAAPQAPAESGVVEGTSPLVGGFYGAPPEQAEPYVTVGSKVKKGDVLCIIEAMKLMNEITADCDGTVLDIGAGNNQVVDYGHVLFRIRKEQP